MQAKLNDGWQFPRVRCRDKHADHCCCVGVAVPEDVTRKDAGAVIAVQYRCEFGHGWFWFVDNGTIRDLDADRLVEDDREIEQRWACRHCTDDRGNPKLVIWPVSTEICPYCEKGTRYDCLNCGEQLRTNQKVMEAHKPEGYICEPCWIENNTVPASEVEA